MCFSSFNCAKHLKMFLRSITAVLRRSCTRLCACFAFSIFSRNISSAAAVLCMLCEPSTGKWPCGGTGALQTKATGLCNRRHGQSHTRGWTQIRRCGGVNEQCFTRAHRAKRNFSGRVTWARRLCSVERGLSPRREKGSNARPGLNRRPSTRHSEVLSCPLATPLHVQCRALDKHKAMRMDSE